MKLNRFLLLAILLTAPMALLAQASSVNASKDVNPVAQVEKNQSWHYGPIVNYGVGTGERSSYKFLFAGAEFGKPVTPVLKAGILSGQFELAGNLLPLWQAYTPAKHYQQYTCLSSSGVKYSCNLLVGGGTYYGVSLTPVIFRWNLATKSRRIQPWIQGAGGLIYTTHKFPPNYMSTQVINGQTVKMDGGTSVWNFSPQGGAGLHYFTRPGRSIDFGVNAVHISSASLGDKNPGVNASVQFQLGYSFWK